MSVASKSRSLAATVAGLLGLQRSFGSELADRAVDGLLGSPISRESIYLGKALANYALLPDGIGFPTLHDTDPRGLIRELDTPP